MSFLTPSSSSPSASKKRKKSSYFSTQDQFINQFLGQHTQHHVQFTQEFQQTNDPQICSQSENDFLGFQELQGLTTYQSPNNLTNQFTQSQIQDELNFLKNSSQFSISNEEEIKNGSDEEMQTSLNKLINFDSKCSKTSNVDLQKNSSGQNILEQKLSLISSNHSSNQSNMSSNNCMEEIIPDTLINIYQTVKQQNFSDWTFVSLIAGQLCTKVFPFGAYNNLKIALLMSLVSTPSSPLHIIAIGRETSHANIVMNKLKKFSQRFLSVAQNYDGIIVKKNDTIEAGPMTLAANGIAYIGNWSRLPSKVVQKYLREIELGIIIVDKLQMSVPLRATIWSYWSLSSSMKKDSASIEEFLNVFGVPIIFDDQNSEESINDDLLNQVSENPSDRFSDFHVFKRDFKLYIEYARNLTVEFDSDAEVMLRDYFIATKNIRPDTLTEKACDVLKKIAESHAKLCLRQIVMCQDVLVSIRICEKFIKLLFDTDSYSSPNESKVTSIEHYDAYMNELMTWYTCFTKDILEKI